MSEYKIIECIADTQITKVKTKKIYDIKKGERFRIKSIRHCVVAFEIDGETLTHYMTTNDKHFRLIRGESGE